MELLIGGFLFFFIFTFGIGILGTIFWIWMLVDVIQREFKDPNEKLIWLLVVLFTHFVGALIYFFTVKNGNPTGVARKFKK